ncbi:hypothetical protein BH11BAC1_BH11BAC1_11070 [soil metagenome]
MKTFLLLIISLFTSTTFAQNFYQKFPTPLILDYDADAVEIGNGFMMADNEVNAAVNFHSTIRLTRTDNSGNILWSKHYDAGSGISIHMYELVKTLDGCVLAEGYIGPDNDIIASQKFILKADTAGNILWAKEYASTLPYDRGVIVQLPDSNYVFSLNGISAGTYPAICKIDTGGNVLSASKFNVSNSFINGLVVHNNSLDVVLGSFYVFNTDYTGSVINWQRQYNNSHQFNSLVSNRCFNGDLIFIDGRTQGGSGDGTSRMFRTDSLGNLLWSRNISAWSGPVQSASTNFDAVTHVAIQETADSNIVGVSLDEGGLLLFTVFDAAGNYLYNRRRMAPGQNHSAEQISNGNFLVASINVFNTFATYSSYPLMPASDCDSILNVDITTGVDSAATMPPLIASAETVTATNVILTATPLTITPVTFCSSSVAIGERENMASAGLLIYPNPSSNMLHVQLNNLQTAHIKIMNVLGEELLNKRVSIGENTIDVSELQNGIYFVVESSGSLQVHNLKFIVAK